MSRGVNKVILVGNVCQEIELKGTTGGGSVANFSVATNESRTDKSTGQKTEKAEFHRLVLFNRLAEIAKEYLRKGSKIYVEGRLQTRKWQDQSGQDRYTTEIVVNEMQMLDSRDGGASQSGQQAPQAAPQQRAQQPQQMPPNDFEDSIPF